MNIAFDEISKAQLVSFVFTVNHTASSSNHWKQEFEEATTEEQRCAIFYMQNHILTVLTKTSAMMIEGLI